jgi:hypothetical protein
VNTTIAEVSLAAADRCDRCGARAYIRVVLPGGGELLFCAHHGRAHSPALKAVDAKIQDGTGALIQTPATAAAEER